MRQDSYKLEHILREKVKAELASIGLSTKPSEGIVGTDLLYIVKRPLEHVDSRTREALTNAAEALQYARNRCALLSFDDIAIELGKSEATVSEAVKESSPEWHALVNYVKILDPHAYIVLDQESLPQLTLDYDLPHASIGNFVESLDNPSGQRQSWQLMKKAAFIPA